MKKLIVLIFILSTTAFSLNAQMSLIIEAGSNLGKSEFMNLPEIETIGKYGFYFAAIPSYKLSNKFAINAEVQYSQEGFNGGNDKTWDAKYEYIRVIPQIEYNVIDLLGIYAGVDLGLNIGEEIRNPGENLWIKSSDFIQNSDLGLLFGARVEISRLSFDIKYNFGLQDINNLTYTDIEGTPIEGVTQTNKVLQFGVGYRFGRK